MAGIDIKNRDPMVSGGLHDIMRSDLLTAHLVFVDNHASSIDVDAGLLQLVSFFDRPLCNGVCLKILVLLRGLELIDDLHEPRASDIAVNIDHLARDHVAAEVMRKLSDAGHVIRIPGIVERLPPLHGIRQQVDSVIGPEYLPVEMKPCILKPINQIRPSLWPHHMRQDIGLRFIGGTSEQWSSAHGSMCRHTADTADVSPHCSTRRSCERLQAARIENLLIDIRLLRCPAFYCLFGINRSCLCLSDLAMGIWFLEEVFRWIEGFLMLDVILHRLVPLVPLFEVDTVMLNPMIFRNLRLIVMSKLISFFRRHAILDGFIHDKAFDKFVNFVRDGRINPFVSYLNSLRNMPVDVKRLAIFTWAREIGDRVIPVDWSMIDCICDIRMTDYSLNIERGIMENFSVPHIHFPACLTGDRFVDDVFVTVRGWCR